MSLSSDNERKGQKRKLADALTALPQRPEAYAEASGEPVLSQVRLPTDLMAYQQGPKQLLEAASVAS